VEDEEDVAEDEGEVDEEVEVELGLLEEVQRLAVELGDSWWLLRWRWW